MLEIEPGPLEEQPECLIAEPSLQSPCAYFWVLALPSFQPNVKPSFGDAVKASPECPFASNGQPAIVISVVGCCCWATVIALGLLGSLLNHSSPWGDSEEVWLQVVESSNHGLPEILLI